MATGHLIPQLTTSTPLGSGGTFTSDWISVENVATIRIAVSTDVNGTLRTQHSPDGGIIIRDSVQPVVANRAEFLSFHPRSGFFRIVYTNGSSAQGAFNLETNFMSEAAALTQSLLAAQLGRTSLAIQSRDILYDYEFDETVSVAPQIRDLCTVQRTSLIADNFRQTSGLDTQTWTVTNTGSGTSAVTDGRLRLATGSTANSTTRTQSQVYGRFISGSHQVFRVGIKLDDAGTTNNKRRWGVYTDTSGYFYELDGTTLYAVSRRAGTDTRVEAASWNVISTFTLGSSGSNRYEIAYFGNTAYFFINGETHHIMSGEVGGLPRTNETNFPNRFENINSGGSTSDVALYVTGTSQQRYGPDRVTPRMVNLSGIGTFLIKADAGSLHKINYNNKDTKDVTVYDSLTGSGTVLATLYSDLPHVFEFGGVFSTGLTIVTTVAAANLTVIFD